MNIMFVCLGNICRSPMAEFVLRDMLEKKGLSETHEVASSATLDVEVGNPVYPPAREELKKHGISPEGKRARQLEKSDYGKYDLFLCMDDGNVRDAKRIFGGDPQGKVKKTMTYAGSTADVADPWYTRKFDVTYAEIVSACQGLMKELEN